MGAAALRRVLGCACCAIVAPAMAGTWLITPSLTVNETATDNVALSKTNEKSDLVTDLSPGIRINGQGGRLKVNFDYQMHNLIYAQDSSRNRTQNALNAQGTLEAVDNWLFIDASGAISQQSISAFGGATSTDVNTNNNSNTTETSSYRVSPYIKGVLGRFADYQLRYARSTTSSRANDAFDSDTNEFSGLLKGDTGLANLAWSLDASSQQVDFGNGGSNEADRLQGRLTYSFDPQFRVSVFGGREANNYLTLDKEAHTTKGAGFEWAPTERTLLAYNRENRFFGNSNMFTFSHRTAGTAWRYSESKDVSASPRQQSLIGLSAYDLVYANIDRTVEATPEQKALLTQAVLASNGLSATDLLPAGFLSSSATLQHRREMSLVLLGVRNSVTFSLSQSESEKLSQGSIISPILGEDFASANKIRQRIASIGWTHRLTEMSSLSGNFARSNSRGTGTAGPSLETTQNSFNVNFSTRLGPNTSAGLGARRVVVDGTSSYTENAVTGVLSHRF